MKRYEDFKSEYKTIVETYRSFNEFCATQDNRPFVWTNPECDGKQYREVSGSDWRGDVSFKEAQDLLLHGYDKNIDAMVKRVGVLQKEGSSRKTKRFADCVGYAPIVPNALMGTPNSMMNQKKVPIKNKVVTILYSPQVSCGVDASEVTEFGCKFINSVMNLERNGYRVRIDYVDCYTSEGNDKRQYVLRIPLKNEHQPVNIKRLSFPLTHVAMQRFLGFDWFEHVPKSKYIGGLGAPLNRTSRGAQSNFRRLLKDNEYLILFGDDVEQIFKQI